jgi:hypothetical protein
MLGFRVILNGVNGVTIFACDRAYTERMETNKAEACTVPLCTEPATETNDIKCGQAQFRCARHAVEPEWIVLARLRLSDMRPLAPGKRA